MNKYTLLLALGLGLAGCARKAVPTVSTTGPGTSTSAMEPALPSVKAQNTAFEFLTIKGKAQVTLKSNKQSANLTVRQWLCKGESPRLTPLLAPIGIIEPDDSSSRSLTKTTELLPVINEMAAIWTVTEKQATNWHKLSRFVTNQAEQGHLSELGKLITAYGEVLKIRKIMPISLDKFLGTEARGYQDGRWQECDWETQAQKAAALVSASSTSAPPVPIRASATSRPKESWLN